MMDKNEMRKLSATIRGGYNDSVEQQCQLLDGFKAQYAKREVVEEATSLVAEVCKNIQTSFAGSVASVVTEGLNTVYPDNPYTFKIEFRESGGKTVADTLLYRGDSPLDPMSTTGGGVWDILAFTLRVALMVLTAKDDTTMLLALDEPFKFLHGVDITGRAYATLEHLQKEFGLTVFCVRQH